MIAEITPKGVALETADLWRRAQTPGDAGGTDARRRDHDHPRGAPRYRHALCCDQKLV